MTENEIWKPVVGYEGLYEISSLGRRRSLITGKFLADRLSKKGYNWASLRLNKKAHYYPVSHLVAKAFPEICGEWFEGAEVDHINGIRNDNRAVNLKVCSHIDNIRNPLTIDKFKLRDNVKNLPDVRHSVIVDDVRFASQREASLFLGVTEVMLSAFKCGRIKNPSFTKHHRVEFI